MEHIRIGDTDVIFDEMGFGKGKITISNNIYNFSGTWGSMGRTNTLKKFISSIESEHFVKKLSNKKIGQMNVKKTFCNLRTYIKDCLCFDLKWYEHMEFQKDFRLKLREFQNEVISENTFVNGFNLIYDKLDFHLILDKYERKRLENLFKDIFSQSEVKQFLFNEVHPEEIFLKELHSKLKKTLSKSVQLCLF